MTKTSPPPPLENMMECVCSDCEESQGRCKAGFGCFSSLKPDDEKPGYIVKKGCIENVIHYRINCENALHPVVCCEEDMCNWNVTPPFPTTQPSKFYLLVTRGFCDV